MGANRQFPVNSSDPAINYQHEPYREYSARGKLDQAGWKGNLPDAPIRSGNSAV